MDSSPAKRYGLCMCIKVWHNFTKRSHNIIILSSLMSNVAPTNFACMALRHLWFLVGYTLYLHPLVKMFRSFSLGSLWVYDDWQWLIVVDFTNLLSVGYISINDVFIFTHAATWWVERSWKGADVERTTKSASTRTGRGFKVHCSRRRWFWSRHLWQTNWENSWRWEWEDVRASLPHHHTWYIPQAQALLAQYFVSAAFVYSYMQISTLICIHDQVKLEFPLVKVKHCSICRDVLDIIDLD